MSGLALFISVFLACAVEAVEATTIVLAAGTARDWKSALLGTGAGLGGCRYFVTQNCCDAGWPFG